MRNDQTSRSTCRLAEIRQKGIDLVWPRRNGDWAVQQPTIPSDRALADRGNAHLALRIDARTGGDALARLQRSREPGLQGNARCFLPSMMCLVSDAGTDCGFDSPHFSD